MKRVKKRKVRKRNVVTFMAEFIKKGDFAGLITLRNCNGFPFEDCERYYNAIDRLKPDIVYFIKYTDEWYDYQLVYRFFYGERLISFEEFQKELVEYVFHPNRIRRFGGIEYLDEI